MMKDNLRKLSITMGISLITFLLGVVSSVLVSHHKTPKLEEMTQFEIRVDQWHRLYEAAGMTGDSEIIAEVFNRLNCANRAGQSAGVMVELDGTAGCRLADGTVKELNSFNDYGLFSEHIIKTHADWSLHNLDFVESVISDKKARTYVHQHQWPQ